MGTRGAFGFVKDGIIKATYNHYSSYPDGLGQQVLDYARSRTIEQLNKVFDGLRMVDKSIKPTENDIKRWEAFTDLSVDDRSPYNWYCLTREAQGDLFAHEKTEQMLDGQDFLKDSLWCEWAYLINLDSGCFEVYEGFNTDPPRAGIFVGSQPNKDGYYPVTLIKSFPLEKLPEKLDKYNLPGCFVD